MTRLTRRDFIRIVAVAGVAGLTGKSALASLMHGPVIRRSCSLMGTRVNLSLQAPGEMLVTQAEEAARACLECMAGLEARFSRYRAGSPVERLNREGYLDAPGKDLLQVLILARQVSACTDGAFDVTVAPLVDLYRRRRSNDACLPHPREIEAALQRVGWQDLEISSERVAFKRPGMAITLDGIAKGYIVDAGIESLRRSGYDHALVEAGGDLYASAPPPGDRGWQVGVQSPRQSVGQLAAQFELNEQAMATSGDYMQPFSPDFQVHHILDPRQGASATYLSSATVIAPNLALADALATALMIVPPDGAADILNRYPASRAHLIGKDQAVIRVE